MSLDNAIVYVDRFYSCADGKTAHGLVRFCKRYSISCIVDSTIKEGDAGEILDGKKRNIPLYNSLDKALKNTKANTFIIGAVSEGGVLPKGYDKAVEWALKNGLNVVSGLHEFISDKPDFVSLAKKNGCTITDVRKIFRDHKRFYTGKIKNVKSIRIALLGTDSAIGKRTVAIFINDELNKRGIKSDMIFTGQTGWMQGWPHGIVMDAMINDFVAGGIEGAIIDSWKDLKPKFMIVNGQGSLVHPFFPGGFEMMTAGQIHGFILVDAPGRPHLDGFPGYPMPDPGRVIKIAELLTDKKLLGMSLNNENLNKKEMEKYIEKYEKRFRVPVVDPLTEGVKRIVDTLEEFYEKNK